MRNAYSIPNRILFADAYTLSSYAFVSPAMREQAAYHLVFRRFLPPLGLEGFGDGKLVFHGLPDILDKTLGRPLEARELTEAREVLSTFHVGGGKYPFDEALWQRVVELGHFPLKIYARRDGAVVNAGEPVVQVVAEPGFGELAAHFEARLVQVWAPSMRATVMRRWLEINEDLVRRTMDVTDDATIRAIAQFQTSDFGDRAGSCAEESEVLGKAHLTSHPGTDTVAAGWAALRASGGTINGGSIRALAHRVVQGWAREEDAFHRLLEVAGDGSFTSHVTDCYDFKRAVTQHLVPLAKEAAKRGAVVVARPDSGDGFENVLFILEQAKAAGLAKVNGRGLTEMTSLRYIYADGVDFEEVRRLNTRLVAAGYAVPGCGIYGIGGGLRDCLHRDGLGATMKLAAIGRNMTPVCKLSPGGKGSLPGLVKVVPNPAGAPTVHAANPGDDFGALELMYDRGVFTDAFRESADLRNTRRRVLEDWDTFTPSHDVLHQSVKARLAEVARAHGVA
jgi:nicotinic acid phosphoribosyltransferase